MFINQYTFVIKDDSTLDFAKVLGGYGLRFYIGDAYKNQDGEYVRNFKVFMRNKTLDKILSKKKWKFKPITD